jgi:hypothetical protein
MAGLKGNTAFIQSVADHTIMADGVDKRRRDLTDPDEFEAWEHDGIEIDPDNNWCRGGCGLFMGFLEYGAQGKICDFCAEERDRQQGFRSITDQKQLYQNFSSLGINQISVNAISSHNIKAHTLDPRIFATIKGVP